MFRRRGSGRLTPAQAHRRVADRRADLLDVSEPSRRRTGHLPGTSDGATA